MRPWFSAGIYLADSDRQCAHFFYYNIQVYIPALRVRPGEGGSEAAAVRDRGLLLRLDEQAAGAARPLAAGGALGQLHEHPQDAVLHPGQHHRPAGNQPDGLHYQAKDTDLC